MIFIEQLHDRIFHDPEWREWDKIVGNYTVEEDIKFGCDHGKQHWLDVARIAADFVRRAGGNAREIALADTAGMLHDCGMICGEDNHAENGVRIIRPYLKARFGNKRPLSDGDIEIICHAIAQHSDCNEINNLVDAALMFADKIDLGKHRIHGIAHNNIQFCENQIDHIDFKITANALAINYVADPDFDFHFFLTHWPKSYEVPQKVAAYLGKSFALFVNNKRITLPQ